MQNSQPQDSQEPQTLQELRALRQQHEAMGQRLADLERQLGIKPSRAGKPDNKPATLAGKSALKLPTNLEQLIGLQGFSWLGILALVTGLGLFIRFAILKAGWGLWRF